MLLDVNVFVEYIIGDSIIKIGTNAFVDIQKYRGLYLLNETSRSISIFFHLAQI